MPFKCLHKYRYWLCGWEIPGLLLICVWVLITHTHSLSTSETYLGAHCSLQRLLCFQREINSAKCLYSIRACSLQDPTGDLRDSVSLASDSKNCFPLWNTSKYLQGDSSLLPNTSLCANLLQCHHMYDIYPVENFELMSEEQPHFQVLVRGLTRLEPFILNKTDPLWFGRGVCGSFLWEGTFLRPQLKQSCGSCSLISYTGDPVMLGLQL